ncbi:MAG: CBS domain-containing protein [Deltaproteobacteria bacterium]|nr:CBS domain-containing protein [Deltaproteobacteria bacterium]
MKDTLRQVLAKKGSTVIAVAPGDTVFHALEELARHNIGAVLVLEGARPVGMLSERDYARKLALLGRASRQTLVRDVMSHPVLTVPPEVTVDLALALMTNKRVRHLPVVEKGSVTGMLSIGDLVNWVISAQAETIEALQEYIAGRYPG